MTSITNIFSLGWRCNGDDLLEEMKLRNYSSPFSYMVIDIRTALHFIKTKFETYTNLDFISPGNATNTFNKSPWIFNNKHECSVITDDYVDIMDMETVCIWNHHYLDDVETIKSLNRRSAHLLDCLDKKPDTLLFLYIEKIQKYEGEKTYFDKSILDGFECNFLIIVPLDGFNRDPVIIHDDPNIKIIYFNNSLLCHLNHNIDDWDRLKTLINELYTFSIEHRIVDEVIPAKPELIVTAKPKKFIWSRR